MHVDDDHEVGLEFAVLPVEVNVRAIEDFASLLTQELDANIRPSNERIAVHHADGVGFGSRNASADMRIAVHRYHECLSTAVENLRQFTATSEILVEAAKKIAAVYEAADQDVKAIQQRIDSALNDAVSEATTAQQRAVEEVRRAAMHRKLSRLDQEQLT